MSESEDEPLGYDPDEEIPLEPPVPAEPLPEPEPAHPPRLEPARAGWLGVPESKVRIPEIFGAVLWALGVLIVGQIILGLIDPAAADPDIENPDGIQLAMQAFGVLGFLSAAIGMTMIANREGFGRSWSRLGLGRGWTRPASTLLFAVLAYVLIGGLIAGLLDPQQEDIAENLGADKDAPVIITVLAGVLIIAGAAVAEELFFRGLLFGGLRQLMPLWPAALVSGVLFGLPHLPQGDLAVAVQLSVFGAILAWAYERSGTLWVPIGMHALNNSLAFYLLVTDKI